MKQRIDKAANYKGIFINNKTIRIALDPDKPIQELEYPEFYDVKITPKCFGKCKYCYMDSRENFEHTPDIIEKLNTIFKPMTSNERPFTVACLEENSLVYTLEGAKKIKDVSIGDYILNETGSPKKIINKIKNNKPSIALMGNKGFYQEVTVDHLFMTDTGQLVEAKDLLNKKLKVASFSDNYKSDILDLEKYKVVKFGKNGRRIGSSIKGDMIKFTYLSPYVNKYLKLTEDVMWLYGISVAEGSSRGLTFHKKESEFADRAKKIYEKITGLPNTNIRTKNNVRIVEFQSSSTYKNIFFNAMGIGYGARNKSIKSLYGLPTNLIRSALRGMFDGDGCYRKKIDKRNNKSYFSLSYKTASKILANELVHILSVYFNIKSSIYHGINKERFIEGRKLAPTDYFMIDIYGKESINKLFPDYFESDPDYKKVNTRKYSNKKPEDYIIIKEIVDVGDKDVVDITLEADSSHLFTISHGVITHNCGGGEPTSHPDFVDFMKAVDDLGIVPNYTTNGMFVKEQYKDDILRVTEEYCGGVAVSCHEHLVDYWYPAAKELLKLKDTEVNFHHIISDRKSIDDFVKIFEEFKNEIDHFVLLPHIPQGRAIEKEIDLEYFTEKIVNHDKLAFGASFYEFLKTEKKYKVSLYEPELLSKFIDLENMTLYPSSFCTEKPLKTFK
jgi:hypothetical protein